MKIAVVGDVHWSQYSSVLKTRGDKFSVRLHGLINSINWVESTAREKGCNAIIYLGDILDRADLNSEEITALNSINWSQEIYHQILVGNHEMGKHDLSFNSAFVFGLKQFEVISEPKQYLQDGTCELCYLPYILEGNRKENLAAYFGERGQGHTRIVFSHNDIKGVQLGKFLSAEGFDIDDITANTNLYLNGHLHNNCEVVPNVINVGNLTGQNFSEDATKYSHKIYIVDTQTLQYEEIENPYAFNFYKLETFGTSNNLNIKSNAVVTLKCNESDEQYYKDLIKNDPNILVGRVLTRPELHKDETKVLEETFSIDHLKQFSDFVQETLGSTDIINTELLEVLK